MGGDGTQALLSHHNRGRKGENRACVCVRGGVYGLVCVGVGGGACLLSSKVYNSSERWGFFRRIIVFQCWGGKNSKTLKKYMRNLMDGILKSWGFGELKNGAKGEEEHSCEAIPALCVLAFLCVCLHDCGVIGNCVHTQDECFNELSAACKIM